MPEAKRRRELELGPIGPWHARITIDAVETNHGRHTSLPIDWTFEVAAEWFGPPTTGFPPSLTPVSARDVVVVTSLEEARQVAERAVEAFRSGGDDPPDLRDFITREDPSAFPSHPLSNGSK